MSALWAIFAYKAMLFAGFILCVIAAWRLFRKDDATPVAEKIKVWRLIEVKGPHSGTVFVTLAALCFVVMVSTKTKWSAGGEDGENVVFASEEAEFDEAPFMVMAADDDDSAEEPR